MWCCKHCKKEFFNFTLNEKANHSRWCDFNPKKSEYKNGNAKSILAMNLARKNNPSVQNQYTKAKALGLTIPESPMKNKPGTFKGKKHSQETKDHLREKALLSPHRRLKKKMINYNGIMLDSTWELKLAIRLDLLNIEWQRPKPIKWLDEDRIEHHYFPDFFLPGHNLYIDPKNPHAYRTQKKKIDQLTKQVKNLIILKSLEEIENFIV